MITATILLDSNDCYVDWNGKLPQRPHYDKELLTAFVSMGLISQAGKDMLPSSMKDISTLTLSEPTLPITIPEIDGLTDLLIVSRSVKKVQGGKVFRMDNFKHIASGGRIELWVRK